MSKTDDRVFEELVDISSRLGSIILAANRNRDSDSNQRNMKKLMEAIKGIKGLKNELESVTKPNSLVLQNAQLGITKTIDIYLEALNHGLEYCRSNNDHEKQSWENGLVGGNVGCIGIGGFLVDYRNWTYRGSKYRGSK